MVLRGAAAMTMFCEYRKTARRGKGENGSIAGNEWIF